MYTSGSTHVGTTPPPCTHTQSPTWGILQSINVSVVSFVNEQLRLLRVPESGHTLSSSRICRNCLTSSVAGRCDSHLESIVDL